MLFALICTTGRPRWRPAWPTGRRTWPIWSRARPNWSTPAGCSDADGKPCGSLFVVDMPDRAAVEAFAAGDPYAKAGVFEASVIRPFREVFRDGAKVAA